MTMFKVYDNCRKCGLCAELCPALIIEFEKGLAPKVTPEAEGRCIGCGQCVSFCPDQAVHLSFQPEEDRRPAADELPTAVAGETLLRSRRSIRRYRDEALPRDIIRQLLETARYAPSASNRQPVRWVVTQTRATTLGLAALVVEDLRWEVAASGDPASHPLAPVVAAGQSGLDVIMRGAPHLAVAVVPADHLWPEDAAIALTYFELAAHANGVGCCWAGYFTRSARRSPDLKATLGVGANEVVAGGQMFGRPKAPALGRLLPPRKKTELTWL